MGGQMYATCCTQQSCDMLHWHVVIVWLGLKTQKWKEMCEALLEFPEGWGSLRKKSLPWGGMDIFWNYTMIKMNANSIIKTHTVGRSNFCGGQSTVMKKDAPTSLSHSAFLFPCFHS